MVTSRSVEQRYTVTMWSSVDSLTSNLTHQSPLIVYVSVTEARTGLAVCSAGVTVQCSVTSDHGEVEQCADMELRDH